MPASYSPSNRLKTLNRILNSRNLRFPERQLAIWKQQELEAIVHRQGSHEREISQEREISLEDTKHGTSVWAFNIELPWCPFHGSEDDRRFTRLGSAVWKHITPPAGRTLVFHDEFHFSGDPDTSQLCMHVGLRLLGPQEPSNVRQIVSSLGMNHGAGGRMGHVDIPSLRTEFGLEIEDLVEWTCSGCRSRLDTHLSDLGQFPVIAVQADGLEGTRFFHPSHPCLYTCPSGITTALEESGVDIRSSASFPTIRADTMDSNVCNDWIKLSNFWARINHPPVKRELVEVKDEPL